MIAIDITNVSKRFHRQAGRMGAKTIKSLLTRDLWVRTRRSPGDEIHALRDVSLQVPAGTTYGIIGRNGSGKSTLLKLITRILTPDEGSIKVVGRVAALIELGAGFHPELTGRENILINGIILGLSRAETKRRTQSIIDFAELNDFIDEPVRCYSSGMYMRLGFSVAVNVDPDVLLIDEVLGVGDYAFTQKCMLRMSQFKESGKTIVLVTHNVGLAATWCDQLTWLDGGGVRLTGPAAEVARAYLQAQTEAEKTQTTTIR